MDNLPILVAGDDNFGWIVIGILFIIFDVVLPALKKRKQRANTPLPTLDPTQSPPVEPPPSPPKPPPSVAQGLPGTAPTPVPVRPSPLQRSVPGSVSQSPMGQRPLTAADLSLARQRRKQPAPFSMHRPMTTPTDSEAPFEDAPREDRFGQVKPAPPRVSPAVEAQLKRQTHHFLSPLAGAPAWMEVLHSPENQIRFDAAIRSGDFPFGLPGAVGTLAASLVTAVPELREEIAKVIYGNLPTGGVKQLQELVSQPQFLAASWGESVFENVLGLTLMGPLYSKALVTLAQRAGADENVSVALSPSGTLSMRVPPQVAVAAASDLLLRLGYLQWADKAEVLAAGRWPTPDHLVLRLSVFHRVVSLEAPLAPLIEATMAMYGNLLTTRLSSLQGRSLLELATAAKVAIQIREGLELSRNLATTGLKVPSSFEELVAVTNQTLDAGGGFSQLLAFLPLRIAARTKESRGLTAFKPDASTLAEAVVLGEILRRPGAR